MLKEFNEDDESRADTPAKRSFKRRLYLLGFLHERPYSYKELIARLDEAGLLDYDKHESPKDIADAKKEQFRRDLNFLKKCDCTIKCDRRTNLYVWHNSNFGLSLTSKQLEAFILLQNTFDKSMILHSDDLQDFFKHLTNLLPAPQRKEIEKRQQRSAFSINLHETTDYRQADPTTVATIERAIRSQQQLEFNYISTRDGLEKEHVVEPRPLVFEEGHVYFWGYSLKWAKELRFRLDNIVTGSTKMLPDRVSPARPMPPVYQLQYWLSPQIARHKVSHHFKDQQVERHADGSATVTAIIKDSELFKARRHLISYLEHCRVISPPELVSQMREAIVTLHKVYSNQE